ncbi:MAG: 2-oxo acid dehydrogenase subunit E2 [Pirellulaceae bacterium]|jgi:pyruvate dehydrogenase E2 component (dihydrolipoamide acetyltransferase)|nr:2-oxo acid dehydrogenase subunit E2 [Pirellulaceae bacterium]
MSDFLMPKLGADMTAGTLVAWRKRVGDPIRRGDIVAEVDTDKGIIDIESFSDGILEALLVEPGTSVPVGTPLARIQAAGETAATVRPASQSPAPGSPTSPASQPAPVTGPSPALISQAELARLRISPSARQRARELGVDPRELTGTGRGGAITREDVERAAAARIVPASQASSSQTPTPAVAPPVPAGVPAAANAPPPPAERTLRMRQAIAAAMARANREIPHYYLSTTIDLHAALQWLTRQNEDRPVTGRLLYGVLLLKAAALALREVPELNAFWQDDRPVRQESIHLGVAISLRGGGLIAPALHNADRKSLDELMHDLRDLVARVRTGGIRSSELADPTITVTSLGEQGVEGVYGVIYPPQVALVGWGRVVERPWCVAGQVVPRPLITATLAGDHRATDGHRGSVYLAAVERLLQQPEQL